MVVAVVDLLTIIRAPPSPHPHPSFALLLIFHVDFNSQLLMADLSAMILLVSVGALLLAVIQFIPSLQSHIWNS